MVVLAFALAGIIVVLGFIGRYLFKKTGIPDVLVLIILGILLGPVFHVIDPGILAPISQVFVVLALIIILFDGGLNLSLSKVIKGSPRATILVTLAVSISVFLTTIFSYLVFHLNFLTSFLLGIVTAGTSSAVVIPLLNRSNVSEQIKAILSLESAFTDAIVVAIGLAVLQFMTTAQAEVYTVAHGIAAAFSIGIVLGLILGIIWLRVLKHIRGEGYDDILTLGIVFLFYALTESLGGNGAIFALSFGLVLGNGIYIARMIRMKTHIQADGIMKKFHAQISFLIMTFFFVYLGLIFSIDNLTAFLYSIILSLILLFGRYGSIYVISIGEQFLRKNMEIMTVMLPRGLAAAVLAELVVASGIPNANVFSQAVITIILSTVVIASVGTSFIKTKMDNMTKASNEKK
jgi:cell volume regulation protein A